MKKTGEPACSAEQLQQHLSQDELQLLFENMISPFSYYRMVYDEDGRAVDYVFLAINRAFELEVGKARAEIIGKSVRSIFPETEQYWIDCFGRVAKTGVSEQISNYSAAFGKWYNILAYSPRSGYVAITVNDITRFIQESASLMQTSQELKEQQLENYRLAHEEPISGLPNRACLYEAFVERVSAKQENKEFMLAIFTPDNLAEILATYGSVISDEIMRAIAQRISAMLDAPDAFYSMTGTDLVLLYSSTCNSQEAMQALERIHNEIRKPVEVKEGVFYISATCGAACYPVDTTDRDDLIMKANLALFQAKKSGKPIMFYEEQIGLDLLQRTRIRNALPKALEHKEFELFFQPQIDATTDRLQGFEALLRWHSTELGEVKPLEFISVAEESRQILPLGAWVLKDACKTLCEINSRFQTDFYMAVNVSGVQLFSEDFEDHVLEALSQTGIAPDHLELEVTESVLVNREFRALERLRSLQNRGLRIALDDFGMGYSSLSMLKDLKITTLKIDKQFVQDSNATVLTRMIVRLAHMLGAEALAEGVETEEQMRFVRRAGCERVQGYFKGLPMPIDSLMHYIAAKECQ